MLATCRPPAAERNTPSPTLDCGASRATILIADDDVDYRELYSDLLESEGFQTLCAKDGEEALAVLYRERVDLALIGVMMPKRDGLSVCRELRANPETRLIPVLLMAGCDMGQGLVVGIESSGDGYLRKPVDNAELLARVRALLDKKRFTDDLEDVERVLLSFSRIVEAKNPYTAGHGERVSQIAAALTARMGLSGEEQGWVRRGAMLHDIGKVGVPDAILIKPGPLSREERLIVNSHTLIGERICAPLPCFRPLLQIIQNHHERLDGTGYPNGLRGNEISILTRVVSLADIYDALTTHRPYRNALSPAQALVDLRRQAERGWWDTGILQVLEQYLGEKSGRPCQEETARA
jgi:putative two-component system response regulator